jgi:hypothetical protein
VIAVARLLPLTTVTGLPLTLHQLGVDRDDRDGPCLFRLVFGAHVLRHLSRTPALRFLPPT